MASRSSRELSEAALNKHQRAKGDAEQKRKLRAQIEALEEQERAVEESERRHRKEAESDEQAARTQLFREITTEKQKSFRDHLADEVITRVAESIKSPIFHEYIQAIAEEPAGCDKPIEFKAMLWETIAGADSDFLSNLAGKIRDRRKRNISNDDIAAVRASKICLIDKAWETQILNAKEAQAQSALVNISTQDTAVILEETTGTMTVRTLTPIELKPDHKGREPIIGCPVEARVTMKVDGELSTCVKREASASPPTWSKPRCIQPNDPEASEPMAESRQISVAQGEMSSFVAEANQFADDPLGSVEPQRLSNQERTPTPTAAPNRKRDRNKDDAVTVASSSTGTTKKQKTSTAPATDKSPAGRFIKHIEVLARNGTLTKAEFVCSECSGQMTSSCKARIASGCQHLYCFGCVKKVRTRTRGRNAAKAICCHVGCKSNIGMANTISFEDVRRVQEQFADELRDSSGNESGVEARDEEDSDDERIEGSDADLED